MKREEPYLPRPELRRTALQRVKRSVRELLETVGISLRKIPRAPYPALRSSPRYVEQSVSLLGKSFRLADAPSFLASYREIFSSEMYRFETDRTNPRIIDCGANYGLSVAYFKRLYPNARITAVEADVKIFELLQANIRDAAGHHDIELINKAVSHDHNSLSFHSEGADGGRTHNLASAKDIQIIEAITLDDMIDGTVDFLKMDIEGAETSALAACTKLNQVKQMFVEYHSFKDSPQQLANLLSILQQIGFRYYIQTQFCPATPLIRQELQLGMDLQLNIFAVR